MHSEFVALGVSLSLMQPMWDLKLDFVDIEGVKKSLHYWWLRTHTTMHIMKCKMPADHTRFKYTKLPFTRIRTNETNKPVPIRPIRVGIT